MAAELGVDFHERQLIGRRSVPEPLARDRSGSGAQLHDMIRRTLGDRPAHRPADKGAGREEAANLAEILQRSAPEQQRTFGSRGKSSELIVLWHSGDLSMRSIYGGGGHPACVAALRDSSVNAAAAARRGISGLAGRGRILYPCRQRLFREHGGRRFPGAAGRMPFPTFGDFQKVVEL
jgi:hypothetical protein